jgi:hypothetical protein
MSDIVERLRAGEPCNEDGNLPCKVRDARSGCACTIAADEIAKLRAEVERLRAALKHYACECWGNVKCYHECSPCGSWARDALEYKGAPTPGNACMARAAITGQEKSNG